MTEKIRTFVSIPVPNTAGLNPLFREIGDLRGVSPSRPRQTHITLRFIGDVPDSRIDDVVDAVADAVSGVHPARVSVVGTGAFPNAKKPRIIWAGVKTDMPMKEMSERIGRNLDAAGIDYDRKEFKPHITVGRIRGSADTNGINMLLRRFSDSEFATFVCSSVNVMRSDLSASGAEHTILRSIDLV